MTHTRLLLAVLIAAVVVTPALAQIQFTAAQLTETDPDDVLTLIDPTETIETADGVDLTGLTYLTPALTPGTSVSASVTAT